MGTALGTDLLGPGIFFSFGHTRVLYVRLISAVDGCGVDIELSLSLSLSYVTSV